MRPAALATALLVLSCTAPPPAIGTPPPTPEQGVLAVTALLDLSGPNAAVGTEQRNAMELWRDQRQQSGTRPEARLTVVDLAGSEARLFIELRRAAVDDRADAVVIGAPVRYGDALGRAIQVAALPVLFTLPLDGDPVAAAGGRWAFALAPSVPALAGAAIADAAARGVMSPALVLAPPGTADDPLVDALEAETRRRGLTPLTEISIPVGGPVPPVVRSSLSVLRGIHCLAPVATCAAVARDAASMLAPTFFYLSHLATPGEVDDHSELAARAVWPASRGILVANATGTTALDQARARFLREYGDRHGSAGIHAATAFDSLALLAAAAAVGGADDRERSRAALEAITMPLIATTYAFSSQRHAGSDPADLAYVRWTGSSIAAARAPSLGTGVPTPTPSPTPSPSATPSAGP